MRVLEHFLVTGGAGFIGSNLVDRLLANPVVKTVTTVDNLTYAGNRENLAAASHDPRHTFIHGDILDRELISSLLENQQIDAIAHLAAESHVDRSIDAPEKFLETNVTGTAVLLEAFRKHLAGRKTDAVFLQVSTDEVFGSLRPEETPFTENSAYAPNSPYSASKAAADHLARAWHHTFGLPVVTAHPSNNYGPRQHPEKLLPHMIWRVMRGMPLPVYGDGRQVRDWLHVTDHCRALEQLMFRGRLGENYVIGAACERANLDVIAKLQEILAELAPEFPAGVIEHVADRPGHDRRYAVDSAKIRKELGWQPEISWEDGLRETVRWYLENPDRSTGYSGERLGVGKS